LESGHDRSHSAVAYRGQPKSACVPAQLDKPTGARYTRRVPMLRRLHSALRGLGIVVLAALLLVPGLLHEHRHTASHACAVCVAAKHSPAVRPSLAATVAPVFHTLAAPLPLAAAPAPHDRPVRPGRAPPLADALHTA